MVRGPGTAVLVAVGAVGGHRAEDQPGPLGPGGQVGRDLQFGAKAKVTLAAGEVMGRGIGAGVHRVVDPLIRPAGGHGDHATVDLPDRAEVLLAHVRCRAAVLAVAGVIDHQ